MLDPQFDIFFFSPVLIPVFPHFLLASVWPKQNGTERWTQFFVDTRPHLLSACLFVWLMSVARTQAGMGTFDEHVISLA